MQLRWIASLTLAMTKRLWPEQIRHRPALFQATSALRQQAEIPACL
jgi:hypothetical protein